MTTFHPIHFIPATRQAHILATPITSARAVGHTQEGGTNHWCFYLETSPSTSIQLDCQPSHSITSTEIPGGSKAFVIISELDRLLSHDAETEFRLDVVPGLTVTKIIEHLTDHGRHNYEFDSNGVGCRYWVTDQINLLYELGVFTDSSQVDAAKDGIRKLWPEKTAHPLDQGSYYG
ncbi:hypothetical protein BO94DRAFT_537003 [Aspergillus sclerotioniger CBS 115572]|uniref:DUF7770 domain-containing protein n=1 Tax=Aspergillus sclerotioniger CBS 115572 TaxID=1450535 RepID=A0A317W2S9_9EURO|nr:hypothetical protein BO94DRAFT_537003 [Aspergillus sclerotioniger CBS 115572]PWY80793.1 hypothetical protein BO94DRAFT_537003 [Aspergillus sclerotioniger CBS 115572]